MGIKSVLIPAGRFQMGCIKGDKDCTDKEYPRHNVKISRGFYMMATEVTQGFYEEIVGSNPSSFNSCGRDCPVENVSWFDAVRMANKLSERIGLEKCYEVTDEGASWKNKDCVGWRLPTEAEWEYAARGGEDYKYAGGNDIDAVGWYNENSMYRTQPVAQKKANGFGVYDMSGNVFEWVFDSGYSKYTSTGSGYRDFLYTVDDPVYVIETKPGRVLRGGSWNFDKNFTRISYRFAVNDTFRLNNLGFRLVRTHFQ